MRILFPKHFFSVKVHVTVKKNNRSIDFNMERITVNVTTPVVCLKRLTNEEISRHASGSQTTDANAPLQTGAKKQKISNKTLSQHPMHNFSVISHHQTSNKMIHGLNKHHSNKTKSNKAKTVDLEPSRASRAMPSKAPSQGISIRSEKTDSVAALP